TAYPVRGQRRPGAARAGYHGGARASPGGDAGPPTVGAGTRQRLGQSSHRLARDRCRDTEAPRVWTVGAAVVGDRYRLVAARLRQSERLAARSWRVARARDRRPPVAWR